MITRELLKGNNADASIQVPVVKLRMVRESVVEYDRVVTGSEGVVQLVAPLLDGLSHEVFLVIGLDTCHRPSLICQVSQGTVNQAQVHQLEVFKPLVLANCAAFIGVHNHPSGHTEPSMSDIDLTRKLSESGKLLGIQLLDHVIYDGKGGYLSMRSQGLAGLDKT